MQYFRSLTIVLSCLILSQVCCDVQRKEDAEPPGANKSSKQSSVVLNDEGRKARSHDSPGDFPSINCPLRKHGIDPHSLKPFEDVKKYIDFLERKDRALWQKPDTIVKELGLRGAETVADLGAGSGYFTFRLSKALPEGKVVAIEIEPEMVRHIHHKAALSGVSNVEVVLVKRDDPSVPAGVDLVFICDVLHHVEKKADWLKRMYDEMEHDARLILIEFKEGDLPEGPPEKIKISLKEMTALVTDAGFVKVRVDRELLPYQYFLVFKKR